MKIYIVNVDALDDERQFNEIPNEEIEKMYEKGDFLMVDRYDSIEELAAHWNSDEIFYPNMSYMRVINDKSKSSLDDIVTITCYNQTEEMVRRDAIKFYKEGMAFCDGSERDRYTDIYLQLINGDMVCHD